MKKIISVISIAFVLFISCGKTDVNSVKDETGDSDIGDNTFIPDKDDNSDTTGECFSNFDCRVDFICVDGTCIEDDGRFDTENFAKLICRKFCEQELLCYPDEFEPGEEKEAMAECMMHCPREIEEELEYASEVSEECRTAFENLLKCASELNCEDAEEYWDGEPFEDSYPCDSIEEHMIEMCDDWDDDWDDD